jgi:tetratricopeptide (TPR) repeat protein
MRLISIPKVLQSNFNSKNQNTMKPLLFSKMLCLLFAMTFLSTVVFAQQSRSARSATPQQQSTSTNPATPSDIGTPTMSLPERHDAASRVLYAIMDSVGKLQNSTSGSRKTNLSAALDKLEAMFEYVETDTLAKALYFFGKAQLYQSLAVEHMSSKDSMTWFANLAIENYDTYLNNKIGPAAMAYSALSSLFLDLLKNTSQGLFYLDKTIEAVPNDAFLYLTKGGIMMNLGRNSEACEAFKKAKSLGSQGLDGVLNNLGCTD